MSELTLAGRSGLPHGGELVDRRLDADEAAGLASGRLSSLVVTGAEAADLGAVATGAYSPLVGFLGAKEHASVVEQLGLADGTLWPIPVWLGLPDGSGSRGPAGVAGWGGWAGGVVEVAEVVERDRLAEAELVSGTADPDHPGVARAVAGPGPGGGGGPSGPVGARALTRLRPGPPLPSGAGPVWSGSDPQPGPSGA